MNDNRAPVIIANATRWQVTARLNGQSYRLALWLPKAEPPEKGWPLLCLLDGPAVFGTAVEAVRRMSRRTAVTGVPPMAVLGIGHHSDDLFPDTLRRRDYSWGPPVDGSSPAEACGGGPVFLAFLLDELLPSLAADVSLDASQRGLFGHSLAGMFVLRALAERPRAFVAWAAISPSIWWNPDGLRAALEDGVQQDASARVFIATGQWEAELPPWVAPEPGLLARRRARDMPGRARALAADLAARLGGGRVSHEVLAGQDHASMPTAAMPWVLRLMG